MPLADASATTAHNLSPYFDPSGVLRPKLHRNFGATVAERNRKPTRHLVPFLPLRTSAQLPVAPKSRPRHPLKGKDWSRSRGRSSMGRGVLRGLGWKRLFLQPLVNRGHQIKPFTHLNLKIITILRTRAHAHRVPQVLQLLLKRLLFPEQHLRLILLHLTLK